MTNQKDLLKLPDTPLIKEAYAELKNALPEALWNHSVRTFVLGKAYGLKKAKAFDEEGLFLAALYHDLGMVRREKTGGKSFTEISSLELAGYLRAKGIAEDKIATLTDAILYHMQVLPAWSKSNEAGLLQIGAWTDIMFVHRLSLWSVASLVEKEYPRSFMTLQFPVRLFATFNSLHACTGLLAPKSLNEIE